MKRISLVVVAPFAYLLLAFIALVGYPFKISELKQIPIQMNSEIKDTPVSANDQFYLIIHTATTEMKETIDAMLNKENLSKIKCIISCEAFGLNKLFEVDIQNQSTQGMNDSVFFHKSIEKLLSEIKKWLIEKTPAQDCEKKITFLGKAFSPGQNVIYSASWSTTIDSTTRIQSSHSLGEILPERFGEYMEHFKKKNLFFSKIDSLVAFCAK